MEPAAQRPGLAGNPYADFIRHANKMCADLQSPVTKITPEAIVTFVTTHALLIDQAPHLVRDSLNALNKQVRLMGEPYQKAASAVDVVANKIANLPLPLPKNFPITKSELSKISTVCSKWRAVHVDYINENKLPLNKWFKDPAKAVAFLTLPTVRDHVKHLDFTSLPLDEDQLQKVLENCPNVTHLILYDHNIKGDFLKNIRNVPKLVHLSITECTQLDDDSMKYLHYVPQLLELNVGGCDQFTPDSFCNLEHVPLLRSLLASGCLKKDALQYLKFVKALRVLDISLCRDLVADGLKHLVHVPHLLELILSGCGSLETDFLKHLAHVRLLNKLSLSGCIQFPPESLNCLSQLRLLRWLSVQDCSQLTTLQFLEYVPLLHALNIAACKPAPDSLTLLKLVPGLTSLIMTYCTNLEPESLRNLHFNSNLIHLDITGCGQLSANSINNLLIQMRALRSLNMALCKQISHVRREQMKREFPQITII
ncbi:MAG: hypothetical protein LLG04_13170 [Parachlamydia sp.]|nr:hypothetical protein [Parachlamydia sp.]